jgi:hypothetical protein
MRWQIGVDPGRSGAVAVLGADDGVLYGYWHMPPTEAELVQRLREMATLAECSAVLERVRSSPQMGVRSAFTFGWQYGACRAALAAASVPYDEVLPQVWQRDLGCLSRGDKTALARRARELYPEMPIPQWAADAVLIAVWGWRRSLSRRSRRPPALRRRGSGPLRGDDPPEAPTRPGS